MLLFIQDRGQIKIQYKLNTTQKKANNAKPAKQNYPGLVAFGQETRWAYYTMLPSPHTHTHTHKNMAEK